MSTVIRWLLFLPAAAAGAVFVAVLMGILTYPLKDNAAIAIASLALTNAVGAYVFVRIGAIVVPRKHSSTANALAVVACAASLFFFAGSAFKQGVIPLAGLMFGASLLGAITAAAQVRRGESLKWATGAAFVSLGAIAWAVCGLWAFILALKIVNEAAGFWGVVVGFFLAPVTFLAAPWYAGVALGDWFPLLVGYGGGLIGALLYGLGSYLLEE